MDAAGGKRPLADPSSLDAKKRQATGGEVLLRRADGPQAAPVRLSSKDKAAQVAISEDGLGAASCKGYRMVRCTHGAASGAWYCEARIEHLGTTGHARLGWATCSADLNAPVGYDKHGYGYRTAGGEKIHEAKREPYGGPSKEGDVVGMYICVSGAGPAAEQELVQLEGQAYRVEKRGGPAERIDGSAVAFAVNGVSQGVAFTGLCGDVFFPACSLFTEPSQTQPASVVFNFGPNFQFQPPAFGALPAPRPFSALGAAPTPDDAAKDEAAGDTAKDEAAADT